MCIRDRHSRPRHAARPVQRGGFAGGRDASAGRNGGKFFQHSRRELFLQFRRGRRRFGEFQPAGVFLQLFFGGLFVVQRVGKLCFCLSGFLEELGKRRGSRPPGVSSKKHKNCVRSKKRVLSSLGRARCGAVYAARVFFAGDFGGILPEKPGRGERVRTGWCPGERREKMGKTTFTLKNSPCYNRGQSCQAGQTRPGRRAEGKREVWQFLPRTSPFTER